MTHSNVSAIHQTHSSDSRRWIAAATFLLGIAASSPALAGVRYVAATQSSSGDKGRIAVEAEGPGIRVEFQDAGDEMFSKGDVLVSADAGATVYILDNKKRRYSEVDLKALGRITGRILKEVPGVFGTEIAVPRIEKLFDVDGPEMLGQATRHARYLLSYEERVRTTVPAKDGVEGAKTETWHQIVQDVWFSREIALPSHDFWLRERFRTGFPELDRLLAAEFSKLEGLPVRIESFEVRSTRDLSNSRVTLSSAGHTVSHASFVGDGVRNRDLDSSHRSMSLVELSTDGPAIAPSRFAPPDGFQALDLNAAN